MSLYTQKQTVTNALSSLCPFDQTSLITYKEKNKKTDSGEKQRDFLDPAEMKAINDRAVREI